MFKQIQSTIVSLIASATGLDQIMVMGAITRPKEQAHGDFAFPCFMLSNTWKLSPGACAIKLHEELTLPEEIERTEAVGPYLNFFVCRSSVAKRVVGDILFSGKTPGQLPDRGETIVIDYSHPNIAKPFHVGHMRTTLIGLALDRILSHLGYKVVSVNHLGDWGTQFGFLWAGCELWGRPTEETVDALVEVYIRATRLRKAQDDQTVPVEDQDKPDVNTMARAYFLRLQDNDPEARQFWQWCYDISLDYFKTIYDRLGISFTHYTGESFYSDKLDAAEALLRSNGLLENSEGALGVNCGKELGFARLYAEDGRSLYLLRDIATALYRYDSFAPTKILYVVGAQQTLHFSQLVSILKKTGHPVAEQIHHIPFGWVPGMKTREGKAILLADYLNEAHDRALSVYREEVTKRPEDLNEEDVAEAVAIGATYFYYLSHSNRKDFTFSWDEALNFQGDTGPYIQYAYARLNSIVARAANEGITAATEIDGSCIADDEAYALVSLLAQFDEVIEKSGVEYEPYHIAGFLLAVARSVSKAYRSHRVVGEEDRALAENRLALFMAVRDILQVGMTLIGVSPIERM